jgi:hypothetical protein
MKSLCSSQSQLHIDFQHQKKVALSQCSHASHSRRRPPPPPPPWAVAPPEPLPLTLVRPMRTGQRILQPIGNILAPKHTYFNGDEVTRLFLAAVFSSDPLANPVLLTHVSGLKGKSVFSSTLLTSPPAKKDLNADLSIFQLDVLLAPQQFIYANSRLQPKFENEHFLVHRTFIQEKIRRPSKYFEEAEAKPIVRLEPEEACNPPTLPQITLSWSSP